MEKLNKILLIVTTMIGVLKPMLKAEKVIKGIKELKEALVAALEIGLLVFSRFRDGVDMGDFAAFYEKLVNDAEFKDIVNKGYDKFSEIPAEVSDLDFAEGLELLEVGIDYTPKFIEVAKKEIK